MAITKNRQSWETISRMAKKAFPDKQIAEIKEKAEGKHLLQWLYCDSCALNFPRHVRKSLQSPRLSSPLLEHLWGFLI